MRKYATSIQVRRVQMPLNEHYPDIDPAYYDTDRWHHLTHAAVEGSGGDGRSAAATASQGPIVTDDQPGPKQPTSGASADGMNEGMRFERFDRCQPYEHCPDVNRLTRSDREPHASSGGNILLFEPTAHLPSKISNVGVSEREDRPDAWFDHVPMRERDKRLRSIGRDLTDRATGAADSKTAALVEKRLASIFKKPTEPSDLPVPHWLPTRACARLPNASK
jgi:hypothetical protein